MILAEIAKTIEGMKEYILNYAMLLAAIGVVTMALWDACKKLINYRLTFNKRKIEEWITAPKTRNQMLILAAGDSNKSDVLYDQPIEKVMGQIQAAANIALEFPDRFSAFYRFLVKPDSRLSGSDAKDWKDFATQPQTDVSEKPDEEGGPLSNKTKEEKIQEAQQRAKKASSARARLGNLVERQLDGLQNQIQYSWAKHNQLISILIGAGILFVAYCIAFKGFSFNGILPSLLGGIAAPFAKDVVSKLSNVKARR